MNKPIKHWLSMLPDGYRERAFRALADSRDHWRSRENVTSMSAAIDRMATWSYTKEGNVFWRIVKMHYLHRQYPEDYDYYQMPELPTTNKPRLRK